MDGDIWLPWIDPSSCEEIPGITIVEGDSVSLTIAAASIIAKEAHDSWVREMVAANPSLDERYGLGRNMGYGTAVHMEGLKTWGADKDHRKSFGPVRAVPMFKDKVNA